MEVEVAERLLFKVNPRNDHRIWGQCKPSMQPRSAHNTQQHTVSHQAVVYDSKASQVWRAGIGRQDRTWFYRHMASSSNSSADKRRFRSGHHYNNTRRHKHTSLRRRR